MTREEAATEVAGVIAGLANKVHWCLMTDRPAEARDYAEALGSLAIAHWNLTDSDD